MENGVIDLKRRERTRFVGLCLVEVRDNFRSMFKFHGRDL